jgi:hypothetical protein
MTEEEYNSCEHRGMMKLLGPIPGQELLMPTHFGVLEYMKRLPLRERCDVFMKALYYWTVEPEAILDCNHDDLARVGSCIIFVMDEIRAAERDLAIHAAEAGDWEYIATSLEKVTGDPEIQKLAAAIIRTKNRRKTRKPKAKRRRGAPAKMQTIMDAMMRYEHARKEMLSGKNKTEAKAATAAAFGKTPRQIETDIKQFRVPVELTRTIPQIVNEAARLFGVRANQLGVWTEDQSQKFARDIRDAWNPVWIWK